MCRAVFGRFFGTPGRLAGENALRDPRRTGATASALMIGLALVSTIGVLAASLNKSIDDLVDEEFTADFLVQSVNFLPFSTASATTSRTSTASHVISRQQCAGAKTRRRRQEIVAGNDTAFDDIYDLDIVEGTSDLHGAEAIVTDDYAEEHGLAGRRPAQLRSRAARSST